MVSRCSSGVRDSVGVGFGIGTLRLPDHSSIVVQLLDARILVSES